MGLPLYYAECLEFRHFSTFFSKKRNKKMEYILNFEMNRSII